VVEIRPAHQPLPASPHDDALNGARYMYDLELDAQGNIVGGEWYQNQHPDFLWLPPPGTKALSQPERGTEVAAARANWEAAHPVPAAWRTEAVSASAAGQPLAHIVNALAAKSHGH